ncbi:DUF3221 domain-containing protein [Oceanobacillus kimchii]|uniref:DUF3221 domain-containing protein n=1 Tax=Oceanobacillus kimchii TaxID=746691 RepID=UPI003C78A6FF
MKGIMLFVIISLLLLIGCNSTSNMTEDTDTSNNEPVDSTADNPRSGYILKVIDNDTFLFAPTYDKSLLDKYSKSEDIHSKYPNAILINASETEFNLNKQKEGESVEVWFKYTLDIYPPMGTASKKTIKEK